ncbi:developmental regulatory protein wetA-like [Ananas comosus]|uniref:Developmental regulatory protein wetA-like n=1 Tax=Ananas comosus TaxID=4615 RepID=A0A6P5GVW3_ANACO|nr:developmental regulatory protein wetA-like [Ananas comosus]
MLAVAAQPHPLFSLLLPHVSLLRLPPPRPLVATAAAKIRSHHHHHRRRRRRIPPSRDHSTADETALDEEDFALAPAPAPAPAEAEAEAEAVETGGGLKGSDVLRALQRAVAAKEASPRRGKKKRRQAERERERFGGGGGDDGGGGGGGGDLGSVPPVEIRSDWVDRIEELERRLEELQDRQYYL